MKPTDLLQKSKQELKEVSSHPYQESLWILAEVLNLSSSQIYFEKDNVNKKQQRLFWNKIQKRKQAEPLEYILREKIFCKNRFYIEKGVFIPRQETETLVQWVLGNIQNKKLKAVDFGAGAGTLCLTLLSFFPNSRFVALEISRKSIKCLKKNRKSFQVEKRLNILKKDVCRVNQEELIPFLGSAPSLIVANPPYIDPKDKSISKEVYFFDSPLALFSDQEGMGHIVSWFKKAMDLLNPKGVYIFEFGWNQLERVREFCSSRKELSSYEIHRDACRHPRIAVCFKK